MIIPDSNSASGSYTIDNSIMMDIESNRVKRTLGTATNQKKGTYSTWFKRSEIDPNLGFVQFGDDASGDYLAVRCVRSQFSGAFSYRTEIGGASVQIASSDSIQIDPAMWYHFVVALDTTQSSATNRIRFYLNGNEIPVTEDSRNDGERCK